MTQINREMFNNLLNNKINLDSYIITESMELVHRYNLIGRWMVSGECNNERLCENIQQAFNKYHSTATHEQLDTARSNLEAMQQKSGKPLGGIDIKKRARAQNCVDRIGTILQSIVLEGDKGYFALKTYKYKSCTAPVQGPLPKKESPAKDLTPQGTSRSGWEAKTTSTPRPSSPKTPPTQESLPVLPSCTKKKKRKKHRAQETNTQPDAPVRPRGKRISSVSATNVLAQQTAALAKKRAEKK